MGVLYFFIAIIGIIVLIFDIKLCFEMANIAADKGHNGWKALRYCLCTGVLGFIYVIALPDKSKENEDVNEQK